MLSRVRGAARRAIPALHGSRSLHVPSSSGTTRLLGVDYPTDTWTNVTSTIISKIPERLHERSAHPLHTLRSLVCSAFPGYADLSAPSPVVTPQQNFDSLSFPSDHPGRRASDSYYVNRELMLRTHTSAHEVETFAAGKERWLLTADVYRRDEIDATHYPVFHQTEGARIFSADAASMLAAEEEIAEMESRLRLEDIAIEDVPHVSNTNPVQPTHDPRHAEIVARHLKLSLNHMILRLFGGRRASGDGPLRVRWIEAYFPFTSPSYEVEVFFGGRWLEILGCGVIQQATLDNALVPNKIGWAFGLGLERIAMVLYSIPDIRLFWSSDERFRSQFRTGEITTFRPYSRHPACFKDVSFWLPPASQGGFAMHDNDFCDLVRDVAGDLAEDVQMIDSFVHPKTNRESRCYRINYRSMDRSLSNDEVNAIQETVVARLQNGFGVEIR